MFDANYFGFDDAVVDVVLQSKRTVANSILVDVKTDAFARHGVADLNYFKFYIVDCWLFNIILNQSIKTLKPSYAKHIIYFLLILNESEQISKYF